MTYPPVPVTPVREYMLYFAAAENDLLDGNYAAALALYIIDVAALTAAPALSDVSRQIFSTISNSRSRGLGRYMLECKSPNPFSSRPF